MCVCVCVCVCLPEYLSTAVEEEEDGGRGREDWEGAECCSSCDTLREREGGRERVGDILYIMRCVCMCGI